MRSLEDMMCRWDAVPAPKLFGGFPKLENEQKSMPKTAVYIVNDGHYGHTVDIRAKNGDLWEVEFQGSKICKMLPSNDLYMGPPDVYARLDL